MGAETCRQRQATPHGRLEESARPERRDLLTADPSITPVHDSGTRLIGREAELSYLRHQLAEHSLVTVTGPGGVGKTRLALAAARIVAETEPTELVVCELADVESPEAVRHAVAARLGIALRPGEALGASTLALVDSSRLLVVLDNCEHVMDAAAEVAEQLLATGPQVRVLTTSREPLQLPEERVMVLEPLGVPDPADDDAAASAPSVVLFIARARQADPTFELDERNVADVARICRSLDGMPLALEIAAARVRVLAPRDIADRLSRRFALLRSSSRRSPERHRSLRAVVDWSFDLLDTREKDLLAALAVYPAGCDLRAAVRAGEELGIDDNDLIDVLDSLVSKSLMTTTTSSEGTRFGMLETLREYGLERLERAGTLSQARDRHADYYAALARDLRAKLLRAWNEEGKPLFVEFDNIRSALTWTLDSDAAADRTFDFLAVLWYHALQFHAEEIAGLADRALVKWPDTTHARWSEVAGTAAAARATIEDYAAARRLGAAAANATGSSQVGVAFGHCALADVAGHADDDPGAALAHLDRADEAAAGAGFEPLRCDILGRRAVWLAQAGRSDEALATADRALDLARAQNNAFEYAWSQHLVGLLLATSQPAAAHEWVTKALAESRELLYPYGTNSSLRGLAVVSAVQGDLAGSAALFSEALTGFTRAGHLGERWNTLAALLSLLVAAGRRESAATLLVGLDASGVVVSRIHAPQLDDIRDRLATELDSPRVTTRGRAMSPDQLLALARNELRQLRRLETVRESQGARTVERQVGTVDAPTAEGTAAELCRVGDLWRVTFAGTTVHLPDLRGVRDLAVLLGRPRTEVPALDLATPAGFGDGTDRPARAAASVGGEGLGTPGDLGERLDARARAEYAARIRELRSELDEADADGDAERGARARQELDFLTQELSAAYGMRGPRRAGDPAEKARSAVTARIRAAMTKIREVHPELGRHLEHSIHTGRFCSYQPDPPITWDVIV